METLSIEAFTRLASSLAGDDPERSLEEALTLLSDFGIRRWTEEAQLWLAVRHGSNEMKLASEGSVSPEARALLEALLTGALKRLHEREEAAVVRERMQMLSAATFEGIMLHVGGVVIDVNEQLCEMARASRDAMLGAEVIRRFCAPEDVPVVMRHIAERTEGAYVIRLVRSDGSTFLAELQAKQGRLGHRPVRVVAVRDVSEREQTLALLRESEQRVRDLLGKVFDVTVFSRDGIVVDVDGPSYELFGYRKEDLIGTRVTSYVAPSAFPTATQVINEQRPGIYESTLVSRDGELVPVEIVGVYSSLNGQPTRVAGVRDLRETRRLEHERRRLEQQVERSQRLDSLGVLAGGIAHDFNNLLVGVLGNADLLRSRATGAFERDVLDLIISAALQAAELTNRLLAYAGHKALSPPRPVSINDLLQDIERLVTFHQSHRVALETDLAPGCVVLGDRTTLTQVLLNLMTNASEAIANQAGTIRVRTERIAVPDTRWDDALGATVAPGDWVLLEVEDDGIGMDESTQTRVFEPFFSTKTKGHGLGLAAALGIVTSHGGAMRVTSAPGRGTCFSVLLPAAADAPEPSARASLDASNPCRVLVVDDEPVVRQQMRRSLELRGFTVLEAADGDECLMTLERQAADLLLLDVSMPGVGGAEVVRRLRAGGSTVPIVLTSGHFDKGAERELEDGSFQAFLRKPYGITELLQAIAQARSTLSNH